MKLLRRVWKSACVLLFGVGLMVTIGLTVVSVIGTSLYLPLIVNVPLASDEGLAAKNVILVIGDGMGVEHVKAGGLYANGTAGSLSFENFPCRAEMTTTSLSGVTDSAAAATAMATGTKVTNGVLSLAEPGDGHELRTMLEYARDQGRSTGLVTTTTMTDATPAAFGAHALDRYLWDEVASDYLNGSHPNVLLGGGSEGMAVAAAQAVGYTVVTDRVGLLGLDPEQQTYVSGQFGENDLPFEVDGLGEMPHLSELTRVALQVLDNDPDGFFLMVEGGKIDKAAHDGETLRVVGEMKEMSKAVDEILLWAAGRTDTVVMVLADHETGQLQVVFGNGAGQVPTVIWATTSHNRDLVPVYLYGLNCDVLAPVIDNTQVPGILSGGQFP